MKHEVRTRGAWPGRVQLRRGWALAHARPWNDHPHAPAALRLERGNDRFLQACARWLQASGAATVLSPALPSTQTPVWRRAGFETHLRLIVFERRLGRADQHRDAGVVELSHPDFEALARIDSAAFDDVWQVGALGLADALSATPMATTLALPASEDPVAFAIVGEASGVAYLQRLAVHPEHTGHGYGTALVRACMRWASGMGARTMLLNTQPENRAAAALYEKEGFARAGTSLEVLAWRGPSKEAP